jgi:hypothetical protein
LNVKQKNISRFKAGAELSGKVNIMDVSVNEDLTDTHEILEVAIVLTSKYCGQPISVPA